MYRFTLIVFLLHLGQSLSASPLVTFQGMCDASGAIPISANEFIVADDEDNVLRLYDADKGGAPLATYPLTLTAANDGQRPILNAFSAIHDEFDLEAATAQQGIHYWISSHALDKKGRAQPERFLFIALNYNRKKGQFEQLGKPYFNLLDDMVNSPLLRNLNLRKAAMLPSKTREGLNIEGMTSAYDGGLWIGLRSPLAGNKAVLFKVANPKRVAEGRSAEITAMRTLSLGAMGIRGLSSWHGQYLIAAGSFAEANGSQIFRWDDKTNHLQRIHANLPGDFNTEAFFTPEARRQFMILSDDGRRLVNGMECKRLLDDRKKTFRGVWISIDELK